MQCGNKTKENRQGGSISVKRNIYKVCNKRDSVIQVKRKRWLWIRSVVSFGVVRSGVTDCVTCDLSGQLGPSLGFWLSVGTTHRQRAALMQLWVCCGVCWQGGTRPKQEHHVIKMNDWLVFMVIWRHLVSACWYHSPAAMLTDLWPSAAPSGLQGLSWPWTCCLGERSSQHDPDSQENKLSRVFGSCIVTYGWSC